MSFLIAVIVCALHWQAFRFVVTASKGTERNGEVIALSTRHCRSMAGLKDIVVDTDGGADDAMALLAFLTSEVTDPGWRVSAVTCVHGNAPVEVAARNMLASLAAVHRLDVPVYLGASRSILTTPPGDQFYGHDGFGDFLDPTPAPGTPGHGTLQDEHAAIALVRMAAEKPGQLTLVCLGPLTNVALAARLDPRFMANLADLYILGGVSRGEGNTKAGTEFNVYMDAEAFQMVLDSVSKPAYIMPWEATLHLNLTEKWRIEVLGALDSPQMKLLNPAEKLSFGKKSGRWTPADALLAVAVLRPDVVHVRTPVRMLTVLGEGEARAATLIDYRRKDGRPPNAVLLEQLDRALVEELLLRLMADPAL